MHAWSGGIRLLNLFMSLVMFVQVQAPAKAGAIAPIDVFVPIQNTGLGPEKTSFFQALSIATKISRGTIEILSDVHLVKKDEKVGFSEATLLQMLKIYPFSYGLKILNGEVQMIDLTPCWHLWIYFPAVYDSGSLFSPSVLDISEEDLLQKFVTVSEWSRLLASETSCALGSCLIVMVLLFICRVWLM